MPLSHSFTEPGFQADEALFGSAKGGGPWPISRSLEIKLLIAVVTAQVAILIGMIVLDGLPLMLGERVKLKVVPVDPRDIFRGDYVILDYEFGRFDPASSGDSAARLAFDPNAPESVGRDVYTSLAPAGDHYEATARSTKPPADGIYIHGKLSHDWRRRLDCGIEAYYVQQGEGQRLEQLIRQRRLMAEVAVWRGHAKLVRLVE